MKLLSFFIAVVVICPLIALVMTYIVCKKMKLSNVRSFGFAADVATFLLFFSVPIAVSSVWDISIFLPIVMFALFIALTFTYKDWRTKKEIAVPQLLKKIWRFYFLLLSISYFLIFLIGLTLNIMDYLKS